MPNTRTLHTAPRGQYRLLAVDMNTGEESVERDFWQEHDARMYMRDHGDDRPWINFFVYDDQGEEVDGRR